MIRVEDSERQQARLRQLLPRVSQVRHEHYCWLTLLKVWRSQRFHKPICCRQEEFLGWVFGKRLLRGLCIENVSTTSSSSRYGSPNLRISYFSTSLYLISTIRRATLVRSLKELHRPGSIQTIIFQNSSCGFG